ncbi:MAG: nucleoside hydrolase [Verrucomicrobiae bacterium]|nr:nucleoside hydrolase [Verrucomicrobiae bacterium]
MRTIRFHRLLAAACCAAAMAGLVPCGGTNTPRLPPPPRAPVKVIFDTDIGNDVDDVLALGMLHSLMTRGACELLAVTVTKPDELAGPFVDAVNTFYGRPHIPIACTRKQSLPKGSRFLSLATMKDGDVLRYPHDLRSSAETPEPVVLLRRLMAEAEDQSLVLVQVGFSSNLAALLDSAGDEHSPLNGRELIRKKVRLLSVMAGAFQTIHHNNRYLEYNVIKDIPAAQQLAREWPTPIVWSGYEIGIAVPYPAASIERDFGYVQHHPLAEAYYLYEPPPHDRPTWDLTAVLHAVYPDRGYFELSPPGRVTVEADGFTRFQPQKTGRDRFLILDPLRAARVREALVQLCSQPPPGLGQR